MGDEMPDLSLKLPNLTASISWSWRTSESIPTTQAIAIAHENGNLGKLKRCGEHRRRSFGFGGKWWEWGDWTTNSDLAQRPMGFYHFDKQRAPLASPMTCVSLGHC